ncbi:MAG TPA: hypothetical protein PKG81_03470, partial [Candidatus Omnitrophota bacterium]|nr:hypothetical protein [Candidatus Omnitrophota bacterium]
SVGYVDGLIECMMPNKRIVVGAGASAVDPLELGPDEGTAELANLITVRAWMLGLSDWRLLMTGKADVLFGVSHMKNDLLDPPESGNRVTSQGVITHAVEMARYLRDKGVITSKENEPIFFSMTGGLDGDVGSGNVERLMHHYGENARIRSLVDISGVMFDPEGLDHQALYEMYNKGMRAASFPKEKLHEGGFVARAVSGPAEDNYIELGEASLKYMNARALDPKTLEELGIDKIYKKQAGLKEDEPLITVLERGVNGVPVRIKVHGVFLRDALFFLTKADMLVPGGGVKDAINEKNWKLFIDENDSPVTKSIVYGANVFMEKSAGDNLEKLGVVIEPDEKANSVGVEISSRQEIDSNLLFRESELTIDIKKEYFRQVLAKCIANAKEKFWALRIEAEKQPDVPVVTGISSKMSAEVIRLTESILNSPLVGERKGDYSPKVLSYLKEYFPDLSQVDKGYSTTIDRVFDRMPSDRIKAIVAKMIAKDVVMYLGIDGIAEACSRAKAEELKVIEVFLEYAHVNGLHKKTKEIVDNKEGLSPSEQMSKLRAVREETMNRVYALFSDKGESDIIKYGRDAETERVINGIIKDVPLRARIFLVHLARVTKNSDTYHYLGIETGSDSHREAVLSSTVYKALKKLQDARDENGELMFPKLIVEIGTSDVLVRNIGERMDKGELSSEQVFISALRSSVEHAAFKSIEGSAWIAAIDDSTGMNYIPVVEAAIINMMAYRGAGLAQIKKIYDSISKEPKTIQELEDMITKRVISIIPKSVPINYDVMRDICDLMAKQIDSAA